MRVWINEESHDLCDRCTDDFLFQFTTTGIEHHNEEFPERKQRVAEALESVGDQLIEADFSDKDWDDPKEYFEVFADQPDDMHGYKCSGCNAELS